MNQDGPGQLGTSAYLWLLGPRRGDPLVKLSLARQTRILFIWFNHTVKSNG